MLPADLSLGLSYVAWLARSRAETDCLVDGFQLWDPARLSSPPAWKGLGLGRNYWGGDSRLLSETMGAHLSGDQFALTKHW